MNHSKSNKITWRIGTPFVVGMLVGMLLLKFTKMVVIVTNFHITSSFLFFQKEKFCSPFFFVQ